MSNPFAGMTFDWSLTRLSLVKGVIIAMGLMGANWAGYIPTAGASWGTLFFFLGLGVGRDDDSEVVAGKKKS
jgi:hypothetical protein